MLSSRAASPMALDAHRFAAALHGDDDALQHEPSDRLSVRGSGGGRVPERWDVGCQLLDGCTLFPRQWHRLLRQEAFMLGLDAHLLGQRGFPTLLQRAPPQPVPRLDRIILTLCPVDVVACPLQPLLPLPM